MLAADELNQMVSNFNLPDKKEPRRIRDRLAGQSVLITGSTGFLAKAFVEKLLRSVDTVEGIYLLIRTKPGGAPPQKRVVREVLGSQAFDRLRASLGDRFTKLCDEKVHVVGGDLTCERLGLPADEYVKLCERITLVVNSAATVTFDERLDLAVELNTLGPGRLLQLARDCGQVPFMHVSTCYVCGARQGIIVEDFSAPKLAREKLPRMPDSDKFDLDALVGDLKDKASQSSQAHDPTSEACRRALIDCGMAQARKYGWNDTYTFTKWIGEQLLVRDHGEVPLTIFRPAIIESSYEEPTPGWIDGLRMADPLIVAYGRGKLRTFPGNTNIPLDLIPVDFVANAMIATLPVDRRATDGVALFHCASSERHPFGVDEIGTAIHRAFIKKPMNGDNGQAIHPAPLRWVDKDTFVRGLKSRRWQLMLLKRLLGRFHSARRRVRRITGLLRQIEQLNYFAKIYAPYTQLDCQFNDDHLQSAAAAMHPDDKTEFPFDVMAIDWHDYFINRHIPGLRSFVLGTGGEPAGRIRATEAADAGHGGINQHTLGGETIFEVFERAAALVPDKPAMQVKRAGRWTRYSYDEALRATGTLMRRFQERGLVPGDKIALYGHGGPEWGITYIAAIRAGMTAVPLDPQLPPDDAWSAIRFSQAKLVCADKSIYDALVKSQTDDTVKVVEMAQPFVPPPAASRDKPPPPVSTEGHAVASILFTSGTTSSTPKAVPLTHRNFLSNATALVDVHPMSSDDEFLSVLPMYHAFEFTGGFLVPIASGATITYVEQLKGPDILAAMRATGTTVMLVVPRLLRMFHGGIQSKVAAAGLIPRSLFRLLTIASMVTGGRFARRIFNRVHQGFGGRLRMFVSGGSSLDPDILEGFNGFGFHVFEGYGLTETSPVLCVTPPGDERAASVGPVLPNVDLEIRNRNLEDIGEIWVKGPSVMSGYYKNVKSTAQVIEAGWFRTGDLGRLDSDGFLFLTGRTSDLIVTSAGKNVYPDEVELRYRDLPFTKEFCVLGMPARDGLGDVVHAVVVLDHDAAQDLDPSSLEREVRLAAEEISEKLPSHQRVAVLHFWDRELPKTSTLKAKRQAIRDAVLLEEGFAGAKAAGVSTNDDDAARQSDCQVVVDNPAALSAVLEILSKQSNRNPAEIRKPMHLLLDLGVDSIGKLDVLGHIESRFGMRIDEDRAADVSRVVDLLNLIGERQPKNTGGKDSSIWRRRLVEPTSNGTTGTTNGHLPTPLLPVRWLVRSGASAFMHSYVRVKSVDIARIPNKGGFILAPNHSSHLDSPSVVTAVGSRRRVWVAGAEDYFFNSAAKRFFFGKMLDTIAFDRKADGVRGLRRCGEALSRGDGLLLFPEGTRSITGELQPFKIGVAVLAVQYQVPIVPIYIDRTFDLLRKGQRLVRPGSVTVSFGEPIYPGKEKEVTDLYEHFRSLTKQLETAVSSLKASVSA